MEGLCGTAIRLAVRDPGCPQAPVFARARRLPALMRGSSCGWLRPRPAIPARTCDFTEAERRVARQPGKSAAGAGTRIFDEGSCPGDVSGSPGASRASPVLPALVKASRAQISIGIDRQAGPAASNEGSGLRQPKRWPAASGLTILSEGSSPRATSSDDQLMCPLGLPGRVAREDPLPGKGKAGVPESGQPRPREAPRTRGESKRAAQGMEDPYPATLLPPPRRADRQGHPRIASSRDQSKMKKAH